MSETADIAGRLRAANPLPGLPRVAAPADALARITATPRADSQPRLRHALIRRPLLAACLGLLALCGIALAANITVRYFDDAGAKPLPPSVRRALQFGADHRRPTDRLAFANTVTAYAFSSSTGGGAVYMTPYATLPGFCAALAVPGKAVQADCTETSGGIANIAGDFAQPWDIRLAPDMHALLGRLAPAAAGDTVRIAFEDGTTDDVPMHGRWFAFAVAGKRTQPGHRPTQLTVLHDGQVIRKRPLVPAYFNTLAAAQALVPKSDGSPGEDAIRRFLLNGLHGRFADGGAAASRTDLAHTERIASHRAGSGRTLTIYAAPVRAGAGSQPGGLIILGIVNGSTRPLLFFSGVNPRAGSTFESMGSCTCVPGGASSALSFMYGAVPRHATRVSVRTADGREEAAHLFNGGRNWVFIGGATPTVRPIALVAHDAAGKLVTQKRLRGPG